MDNLRTAKEVFQDYYELKAKLSETNDKVGHSHLLEISDFDIKLVVNDVRNRLINSNGKVYKGFDLITFFITGSRRYLKNRGNVKNSCNYFEEKEILDTMISVFGYILHKGDELTYVDLMGYIAFRRNRLIKDILDNPPKMNSTSVMKNVENIYSNVGKTKILKDFFEPMYVCMSDSNSDFSSFCVLDKNFPT